VSDRLSKDCLVMKSAYNHLEEKNKRVSPYMGMSVELIYYHHPPTQAVGEG